MKVLFVVSECVPFIKSGGLADVAGSLPKELKSLGTDVRVILPKYQSIEEQYKDRMEKVCEFSVSVGWREQYCGIESLELDGVTFYFVDNEYYFKREGLYGYWDDGERFSYFTKAVLDGLGHLDYYPDILHCHDWHTAMIPFLLRTQYQWRKGYSFIKTIFTIHNLQFQGVFPKEVMTGLLGIDESYFHPEQLEFYGNINFMKAALISSDFITTVSATYRDEILTPYYGEKLEGVLRGRAGSLQGILNGIDDSYYSPEENADIVPYKKDELEGKKENKKRLQRMFGLEQNPDVPIVSVVSRLTKQKGLDLVKRVFHEIMQENLQFIILGTGDQEFEQFFKEMANIYPGNLRVTIGFNEGLAKQLYAGSDLFLMPSRFEPCGLGQMIALRYGTLPLVRETGGLNDTVQSYNEETQEGHGFSFRNFNAHDMLFTLKRALSFYHNDQETWKSIVNEAMGIDCGWAQSAFKYNQLYANISSRSESHVF